MCEKTGCRFRMHLSVNKDDVLEPYCKLGIYSGITAFNCHQDGEASCERAREAIENNTRNPSIAEACGIVPLEI